MPRDRFQQVSQAPTRPGPPSRASTSPTSTSAPPRRNRRQGAAGLQLDEKLRQAYFWITNHAIISPFYDVEYNEGPPQRFTFGDQGPRRGLRDGEHLRSWMTGVFAERLAETGRRWQLLRGAREVRAGAALAAVDALIAEGWGLAAPLGGSRS